MTEQKLPCRNCGVPVPWYGLRNGLPEHDDLRECVRIIAAAIREIVRQLSKDAHPVGGASGGR